MIEYRYPWPDIAPNLRVPVLHRVTFTEYRIAEMREWLVANCRAPFYVAPGWTSNFVEFEDNRDATAFAMRWK